jgi:predicted PurR-regulated permease PerM
MMNVSWKRIIGREWLIFVGCIFIGIISFFVLDYINEIPYQAEHLLTQEQKIDSEQLLKKLRDSVGNKTLEDIWRNTPQYQ